MARPRTRSSSMRSPSTDMSVSFPLKLTLRVRPASASIGLPCPNAKASAAASPEDVETHFDAADLVISIAASRLGLVLLGGCSTELVDSLTPSSVSVDIGLFCGAPRWRWRSSLRWMVFVGCPVGFGIFQVGVPAHACWSEAFDLDDSRAHLLQELADMRKFRGSIELS